MLQYARAGGRPLERSGGHRPGLWNEWREKMLDVAYVVGTIVFFILVDLLGKAVDKL
ncbi:hypothetical protein H7U32_08315 [Bifidobacterium pullorum subsp. saeculare]|uniref:Uncharacterized protein n=1 Tax=Bifidobacterium pullorum subsp. saeculare TaxID=78257 RepID=A0A939B8V9_9BIFI|nr:hypothetical protein [Bifidobacterium pullorum]MBM6700292.1 hypothetical protein [Bifidobacterium pullorum subsp. saeculare]